MYKCVGCGRPIHWDGKGIFAYTCGCGANVFQAEGSAEPSLPASLVMAIYEKRTTIPHIDYYVGFSAYQSEEKTKFIDRLKELGAIWSWDCPECREKIIRLRKGQMETGMLYVQLHPALLEAIKVADAT